MRIEHIRSVTGPNLVSHNPVLTMRLDLEDLTGKESCEMSGFIDRLLAAIPGIGDRHRAEPTGFGHIVEHVCRELADRAGISVNRAETIGAGADNLCEICVEYTSEAGVRRLLEVAVEYVQ